MRNLLVIALVLLVSAAGAATTLDFEYLRVKGRLTPDLAQRWDHDKKFRKSLTEQGFSRFESRGTSYLVQRQKVGNRDQLIALMGGVPLGDDHLKLLEVYDFAAADPRFRGVQEKGEALASANHQGSAKKPTPFPVLLVDTVNVLDVPPAQLGADFTPWGQRSVMVSTAYFQGLSADLAKGVFAHEYAHTLDSNVLDYDLKAAGKDQIHHLNELTSASNAFSEAWAEFVQLRVFPDQKQSWGGDGLAGFKKIIVERENGGYDEVPVQGFPGTGTYLVPGEGRRALQPGDLLKVETVNLQFLLLLADSLDARLGPGKGEEIIFETMGRLNRSKGRGPGRDLGAFTRTLLTSHPEAGPDVAASLRTVTAGTWQSPQYAGFFDRLWAWVQELFQEQPEPAGADGEGRVPVVGTPGSGDSTTGGTPVQLNGGSSSPFGEN